MKYGDDTLPILQNFQKTIWMQNTWMEMSNVQVYFKINCEGAKWEKKNQIFCWHLVMYVGSTVTDLTKQVWMLVVLQSKFDCKWPHKTSSTVSGLTKQVQL